MRIFFVLIILLLTIFQSFGQVVQWRGENRDGHFKETGLLKEWPKSGPELILEVDSLGKGYSSPIANATTIFVTGKKDTTDFLTALDFSGNVLWSVPFGPSWSKSFSDTRSSPTIDGNKVYVQSGSGRLVCINADSGDEIWAVEVDKDFETQYHLWGNSETPLIVDDKVIVTPAGGKTSVVAFDKITGNLIWQSAPTGNKKTARAYASATIFEKDSIQYILAVTTTHLLALNPDNGEISWSYEYYIEDDWYDQPGLIWTNTPVMNDRDIFISKGYDYKAVMLTVDSLENTVSEKFIDHTLDNHHHGLVLVEGYLYGANWRDNKRGKWVCMKWETGEIMYVNDWKTKGTIVAADGMLYCYNERGGVALVKPDPDKFDVVSEFKVSKGSGPHWAHPFIANGKLFLRHGEVLMVYDIKK